MIAYEIVVDYTLDSSPGELFRLRVKGKRETEMTEEARAWLLSNIMLGAPKGAKLVTAEVHRR